MRLLTESRGSAKKDIIDRLKSEIKDIERSYARKPIKKRTEFIKSIPFLEGTDGVRVLRSYIAPGSEWFHEDILRFKDVDPQELVVLGVDKRLKTIDPSKLLFLDTETTGLAGGSGTVAFLIGVGRYTGDGVVIEQLFLDKRGAEGIMLEYLEKILFEASGLVTFNGKSYDVSSILRNRSILFLKRDIFADIPHIDLLHSARRIYGYSLDSVSLKSLERTVLAIERVEDIESSLIPQFYRDYLFYGMDTHMKTIFEHNLWDVLSMFRLAYRMCLVIRDPWSHPNDMGRLKVAKMRERVGDSERKIKLLYDLLDSTDDLVSYNAYMDLAKHYKRKKEYQKAVEILIKCTERHGKEMKICIEIAKIYEHNLKDFKKALLYTEYALDDCLDFMLEEELIHRKERLLKKIKRL